MDFRFFSTIAVITTFNILAYTPLEAQVFGSGFESVAITDFSASPSDIAEGQSTELSWTTLNATECTPTDGAGNWDQTTITLPGGSQPITINTPGTYDFTLTCLDEFGGSKVGNTTVVVHESVEITDFSASPETITEGQSTTLRWTTQNATECTPTGGAGGWDQIAIIVPNGSVELTIDTSETHEFTLTCQGEGGDSVVANTSVVVEATVCGTPDLSVGLLKPWEEFWLIEFPGPSYDNRAKAIPKNGYMALKFNTGDVVDDGKLTLLENSATTGLRRGTISECPGDFDTDFNGDPSTPADPTNCSWQWGLGDGIRWATNGRSDVCQLKPNTDYYFNVTFTDGVDGSTSTCVPNNNRNLCYVTIQHVNL